MKKIITFIHGFCMALADSVPGVSGGTIAFLLGFYDCFVDSLDDLISGTKEKRIAAVKYLIKLMIGWAIGFCLAVLILANVFETHIYQISSLFMGFIVFAIPIVIMEEKTCLKEKLSRVFFVLIGIALVSAITYFNPVGGGSGMDLSHPGIAMYLYVFVCGAVAICAMILPGISGSTLLLIFGIYLPIITAIKDILHLQFLAPDCDCFWNRRADRHCCNYQNHSLCFGKAQSGNRFPDSWFDAGVSVCNYHGADHTEYPSGCPFCAYIQHSVFPDRRRSYLGNAALENGV